MPNMFDPTPDLVKVTRCKDCRNSFTPMTVLPGTEKAVPTVRCCLLTGRVKRDDGYCDEGKRRIL